MADTKRALHRDCILPTVFLVSAVLLLDASLYAQSSGGKQTSADEQASAGVSVDSSRKSSDLPTSVTTEKAPGLEGAGYEIKQSFEFGGRISSFTGNSGMWGTFVNLGSGPRLLEYTLDMRAPSHHGLLFDDLSFSNYGYGGDPNDVSRLRVHKGTLYNFTANFRRDRNVFDYDLLANPLNPPTSVPNVPVLDSPHSFYLTRRMSDVNLNLFPVGKVRFRLGWSKVVNEGSAYSTVHEGTDALLLQPTLNTTDNYQFGISLRLIPRTSINYDQFYTHFKGDTTATLNSLPFNLAGPIPVDLGLPFNTAASQPCATPLLTPGNVNTVNPACNGYFGYDRNGRTRNSFPVEQFSFQSNYFRRLDLSGRFSYSNAEANMPSAEEVFSGLITRTRQRSFDFSGGSLTHRLSVTADFGLTFNVTDKFRIVDEFRFDNFRIPSGWTFITTSLFGATLLSTPNAFTPATCPPPFTAATCPQHNSSSGADIINDAFSNFLKQDEKLNTVELEYDFTRRMSGHIGYRYQHRDIVHTDSDIQLQTFFPGPTAALASRGNCAPPPTGLGGTVDPLTGICTVMVPDGDTIFVPINAHSLLLGFSARPTNALRVVFDTELYSADNTYTRISPRQRQEYRLRVSYKPKDWIQLGGAVTIFENRNNTVDIGNLQHNRSFVFNATIAPQAARWGLDLSYDYNDIFSQTNICYVTTPAPPGALTCPDTFLSGLSVYNSLSHNGAGSIYVKPIHRVTFAVGYTITSSTGNTLILNPIAPTGPLNFNYHLPTASLAVDFSKRITYKTSWNYYDYNEKSDPGPTLPRDFRGNVFTLSLRCLL
jgi:hypothetical protein